jgi:hypothetical protein
MKLSDHDKKFIEAMFIDHCTVPTVQKVFPQAHRSSLSLLKHNFDCFGTVWKPDNAKKPAGRPSKITLTYRTKGDQGSSTFLRFVRAYVIG